MNEPLPGEVQEGITAPVHPDCRGGGALPLTEVTVPIGTREVVFRHPQYGERRQMVEVGAAGTADVTVWFGADAAAAAAATLDSPAPPPLPPVATPGAAPRLAPLSAPRAPRSDSIR